MRPTVALIGLLTGALSACGTTTSGPPRLGYAPPSAGPDAPSAAYAGQPAGLIWNQLLDRLIQSPLKVDLADPERGLVVASYSGDPEPYVTCGWILVDRGGETEQVPASGAASFRRVLQGRQLDISRGMKLDARLVVQVEPDGDGAGVATTSNYVLTKTVVAEDGAGWSRGRSHEVIAFSAGERGQFNKGTVCQPNGALERIVLDILPRTARAQQAELSETASSARPQDSSRPDPNTRTAENSEPGSGTQTTKSAGPGSVIQPAEASAPLPTTPAAETAAPAAGGEGTIAQSEMPDPTLAAAPEPEAAAPRTPEPAGAKDEAGALECPIADKIFCTVLEVTDPYRRANLERNLGLAVDAIQGSSPLLSDSDLGFDISLPSYDAYLTVSFFMKDGTVHHVLSGWDRRWPANAREFVSDAGLTPVDAGSIELVVALATDVLVFPSPRPPAETAELYLSDLRQRLLEISKGGAPAQIAASLLVVTPA